MDPSHLFWIWTRERNSRAKKGDLVRDLPHTSPRSTVQISEGPAMHRRTKEFIMIVYPYSGELTYRWHKCPQCQCRLLSSSLHTYPSRSQRRISEWPGRIPCLSDTVSLAGARGGKTCFNFRACGASVSGPGLISLGPPKCFW